MIAPSLAIPQPASAISSTVACGAWVIGRLALADGLARRRPGGLPRGHVLRVGHDRGREGQIEVDVHVEAEELRVVHEVLRADLRAELAEDNVRGKFGRACERNRAVVVLLKVGDGGVADVHRRGRLEHGGLGSDAFL